MPSISPTAPAMDFENGWPMNGSRVNVTSPLTAADGSEVSPSKTSRTGILKFGTTTTGRFSRSLSNLNRNAGGGDSGDRECVCYTSAPVEGSKQKVRSG